MPEENKTGEQQDQQQQQQQVAETPDQKIARLERENGELKTRETEATNKAKEHEDSAKFWHEKARGAAQPQNRDGAPKPGEGEEEDTTDLLELAGKGPKAMKEWLKKQGFVSRDEAEQLTNRKAEGMVRQAQVVAKYPELNDQKSDFFKETTQEYGRLKERGVDELTAMETAAELVALRRGKGGPGSEDISLTDPAAASNKRGTEEERRSRAKAQGGEGRRGAQKEESDDLDETQIRIAEAFGISTEAYKKRAKEGVQFARQ